MPRFLSDARLHIAAGHGTALGSAAPHKYVAVKESRGNPEDAGKTTSWLQLATVTVTTLVCGVLSAYLFQPSVQGRIVLGGGAQQSTPENCMQLQQHKAATMECGGAPVPVQAASLSPPDNPGYPSAQPGAAPNIPDLPAFAQQLWDKYQQRLQGPNASGSIVVYKCAAGDTCGGGWGDRLRGIVSLFYYALLTDSQFDIVNTRPLDLADPYPLIAQRRPAQAYREEMGRGEFCKDGRMAFLATDDLRATVGHGQAHVLACNDFSWAATRRNPHLAELVALYQLDRITTLDMFRVVIQLYFSQLSPQLQSLVEEQLQGMAVQGQRTHRVGVHIRTGTTWGDPLRHPIESALAFADQALLACKEAAPTPCWIYVTADALPAQDIFLEHIRKQQPEAHVTAAAGTPVHVDRMTIDANDTASQLKSHVDWELLRRMDHLVLSRSGFGETAAWTSLTPAERLAGDEGAFSFFIYDSVIGMPPGRHP